MASMRHLGIGHLTAHSDAQHTEDLQGGVVEGDGRRQLHAQPALHAGPQLHGAQRVQARLYSSASSQISRQHSLINPCSDRLAMLHHPLLMPSRRMHTAMCERAVL